MLSRFTPKANTERGGLFFWMTGGVPGPFEHLTKPPGVVASPCFHSPGTSGYITAWGPDALAGFYAETSEWLLSAPTNDATKRW